MHDPLSRATRTLRRKLSRREAAEHALLFRHHVSQWRTWAVLAPEHLLRRGLLREECLQALDLSELGQRPHSGPLLYEQLFGYPAERFLRLARAFLEEEAL